MATHSSDFVCEISWTEEPGRLRTHTHTHTDKKNYKPQSLFNKALGKVEDNRGDKRKDSIANFVNQ